MDREKLRELFQKQIEELDTDKLETMTQTELFGIKDRLIKAGLRREYDDLYWKLWAAIKEKRTIKFAPNLLTIVFGFFSSIRKGNGSQKQNEKQKPQKIDLLEQQQQKALLLTSKKAK